nr:hypothetical protein [Tanacetum cinerariifolium]
MANLSKDIQCAGSDTWPPMLDRTDFASWQRRIRLYCQGKENEVNILKSIDEGPFLMGTFRENLAEGNEDIYTLINHYTVAKDIWDNVKMLLEGSELTKEDRESQLYDDFENFRQNKGETIHDYYVRGLRVSNYDQMYAYLKQHEAHANENKMMLDRFTQHNVDPLALMNQATVQDGKVVVQNVQGRQNRGLRNNTQGAGAASYGGAQNRVENANPEYFEEKMLLMQAQENKAALDEEQLLFITGGQDNIVDEDAPTAQTMFMVNLTSADPVYDKASPSYDSDIQSDVPDHEIYQDAGCGHHEVHEMHDNVQPNYVVDSHTDYANDSTIIPYDQYVKDNAMSVVQSNVSFVPNDAYMMIINEMYEPSALSISANRQYRVVNASLIAELATYKEQVKVHEIIKTKHVSAIMHNSEETLEIAEITRKKINDKMKDPECVKKKVKIAPHDYSKENYLATFTPHKQLTPEQIFWSKDLLKMKDEALKEQTTASRPIKALTVQLKDQVQSRGNTFHELREKISRLTKKHSDADPILDLKALDSHNKELHVKFNALHDLNER